MGNGVALMNKTDYLEKAYSILNDNTKFRKIFSDNTDKMEAKLNRLLLKLHKAGHLNKATCTNLRFSGSHLGKFYGLRKVHKQSVPLRPIISANETFCHATAKYLAQLLAPLVYNGYTVKDTFSFVSSIKSLKLSSCYMISFDVESLFTNVPLHETINIILNQIYTKNAINTSIPESNMHTLLT